MDALGILERATGMRFAMGAPHAPHASCFPALFCSVHGMRRAGRPPRDHSGRSARHRRRTDRAVRWRWRIAVFVGVGRTGSALRSIRACAGGTRSLRPNASRSWRLGSTGLLGATPDDAHLAICRTAGAREIASRVTSRRGRSAPERARRSDQEPGDGRHLLVVRGLHRHGQRDPARRPPRGDRTAPCRFVQGLDGHLGEGAFQP